MDGLTGFFGGLRTLDLLPLAFACVLGGLIGLEREINGRPAGLRTHILVCLSSTMLILVSRHFEAQLDEVVSEGGRLVVDPNRMGAGIVTGIGFLGAATVLRSGDVLRGLTTAACIWYVAGLGIVLGNELYGLACAGTLIVLVVLTVLNRLVMRMAPLVYRRLVVLVRGKAPDALAERIRETLAGERIQVLDLASARDGTTGECELDFRIALRNRFQAPRVVEGIADMEGVARVRWELGG